MEDDDRIRLALTLGMEDEGYTVSGVGTAEQALARQQAEPAEAVLVDLMLPGLDGFDCVRELRRMGDALIMVVSARDDTHDVVAALEAGADDYLVKPVAVKELSARLRAVRRRTRAPEHPIESVRFGDFEFRADAGELSRAGIPVPLTRTEFLLLRELTQQSGRVLSRRVLLDRVWGYEFGDERVVDVHVARLRRKIEPVPSVPRHLLTVRGLGYRLQR